MRFQAPRRDQFDPAALTRPPLSEWADRAPWFCAPEFPSIDALNAARPADATYRFAAQTRALLDDGLHYESRIAMHGVVATRSDNWHDFLNALVWLRHAPLKHALNARQVEEIAHMGPKRRSRAQCALTHFDEAGIVAVVRDPGLMALWDAHDWHGLFWRERAAWHDGRIAIGVFGHALLEHALWPGRLLVGKALAVDATYADEAQVAAAIRAGAALNDPLELRPLPLSGIPGWHVGAEDEGFYTLAPCFQPVRSERNYPRLLSAAHSR